MKLPNPNLLLSLLTVVTVVLAVVIGSWRYGRLSAGQRRLLGLVSFDATANVVTSALYFAEFSNLFLFPVVLTGTQVLLGLLYRQVLQSAAFARALPWLLLLTIGYVVGETAVRWGTLHYYTGSQIITDLLALLLAGLFFRKLLNELHIERLSAEPFFWVSAALAVHSLGDLLIALSSNYLHAHYSVALQRTVLFGVRNLLSLGLNLTYCLALWMPPPKSSS